MDKNEYNLKLEEIEKYVDQGNYGEAARVADTVDWKRVRNVKTLCLISEIYEAENRYEDSKALLMKAYRRSPVGRSILYRLVEVTIHLKQFDEAIERYSEYVQAAPHDNNKYILKYRIYRGRGSSVEEQIDILKEYLSQEYSEKWAYELARLYQQAGRVSECLATCDDLVLWFHSGKYVIKALELKSKYTRLTPKQQEILDRRLDEEEEKEEPETLGQEKKMVQVEEHSLAESIMADTEKEIAQAVAEEAAKADEDPVPYAEEIAGDVSETINLDLVAKEVKHMSSPEIEKEEIADEADDELAAEAGYDDPADPVDVNEEAVDDMDTETAWNGEESETGWDPEESDTGEDWDDKADDDMEDSGMIERETEAAAEAPADAPVYVRPLDYNAEELPKELARSVREIIAGVGGPRGMEDADTIAKDQVIEQSKEEQEAAEAARAQNRGFLIPDGMRPGQQAKQVAGRLSIDDILLSMGERGTAARQAAEKKADETGTPEEAQDSDTFRPAGVVSAVDEALLNLNDSLIYRTKDKDVRSIDSEEEIDGTEEEPISAEPVVSEEMEATEAEKETARWNALKKPSWLKRDGAKKEKKKAAKMKKQKPDTQEWETENGEWTDETVASEEEEVLKIKEIQRKNIEEAEEAAKEMADKIREIQKNADDRAAREIPVGEMSAQEMFLAKTRKIPTEEVRKLRGTEEATEETGQKTNADVTGTDQEASSATAGTYGTAEMTEGMTAGSEVSPAGQETEQPQTEWKKNGPVVPVHQRDLFDGFLEIQNLDEQIAMAISRAEQKGNDKTSRTGNILIFGGHGCGKTTIATGIAKAIAQDTGSQFVKMAKIYASDFNRKDIASTVAKISGGILIIEEAGDLDDGVVDQLTTAMEFRTDGLVIILEDEQKYIHDLLMRHPRFTMKFTSQIFIPVFTIDELVRFGQIYGADMDYVFSEGASKALADQIGKAAAQGEAVSITNVIEMTDRAIARSNKFLRKLTAGKKRYDENNCIILQEKDFR